VLAEHAREYFDLLADDPFMLVVASVLDSRRLAIPSVSHVDRTCRVQTVPPDYRGRYRRMIERFYARTGVPLVLNTSLNIRGEPIVETPDDALGCFLSSSLDVLEEFRLLTLVDGKRTIARSRDCSRPRAPAPWRRR
jgi:carbamoyltransferase